MDRRNMEIVECANKMWDAFATVIKFAGKETVEQFLKANERIHELVTRKEEEDGKVYPDRIYPANPSGHCE